MLSSEDYIKGYNNGLIAGLTQKPLIFGLGVPNTRKAFEVVLTIPEDNYGTYIVNPCSDTNVKGGINWGDGVIEVYTGGTDNLSHTYNTAGSYKVTIESDMLYIDNVLSACEMSANITQISIPALTNGITVDSFCYGLPNLINVTLAEGLKYAKGNIQSGRGHGAFSSCNSIETITIPSTLNDAMCLCTNCLNLKSVILKDGLTTISDYMFTGCKTLENAIIPNTVTRIGVLALGDCSLFGKITYGGTMEQWSSIYIGSQAFRNTSNVTVVCSDGNITI